MAEEARHVNFTADSLFCDSLGLFCFGLLLILSYVIGRLVLLSAIPAKSVFSILFLTYPTSVEMLFSWSFVT